MKLRRGFDWFFRTRRSGRIVVVQWPNLPLWIFLGATATRLALRPEGSAGTVVSFVNTASLLWWASDETLRGVTPFRRTLGGLVIVTTLLDLFR